MNINDLSKEEIKVLKEDFLVKGETDIYRKAQRIFIISIIGLIFSTTSITLHTYINALGAGNVIDAFLLVFTLFFIWRTTILKRNELNKFLMQKEAGKAKSTISKKKK